MRMQSAARLAVASGAAMAVVLGSTAVADASTAKPKPVPHYTFTKKHPRFTYRNNVGRITGQVTLAKKRGYPVAWSFTVTNAKLKAIARGPMTCVATGLNGKYHDRHVIPVGYIWHSTVGSKNRPHKAKKVYTLSGTCTFPVQNGGKPGIAIVSFAFRYAINPASTAAATQANAPVITARLRLAG